MLVVAAGCSGAAPQEFRGEDMEDYFPFAENLSCEWQFVNEDDGVSYKLIARIENEEFVNDIRQFTVEYTKDCVGEDPTCVEGDFVRSMTWSLQGNQGIHLHKVETAAQGETVFEPSLRFLDKYMKRGDQTVADAGGNTYTTTLEEFGACPVLLDWDQCAKLVVESSGGPDSVTGTYWVINDFNIVAMNWDEDPLSTWQLSTHLTIE